MSERQQIATWLGRPITDLTKEELIEVINYLAGRLTADSQEHIRQLDVWRSAAKARATA